MARDSWLKRLIWLRGSPAGGSGASYEKTVGPAPIISIADAKAKPAKSLIIGMEPIQAGSGDPSPDNIRPISGRTGVTVTRTGKNLLSDGTAYRNGNQYTVGASSTREYPFFLKAGTYTASNAGTASYMYWQLKGTSINNIIHNSNTTVGTFTLPQDGWYRLWFYTADADASYTNIQIELGSTASDYDPYVGESYPVTFPNTVYGGTVDVVSGVLTVTHEIVTFYGSDSEVWGTYSTTGVRAIRNYSTYGWKGDASCLSNMFGYGGETYAPANGMFGWKNDTTSFYLTFRLNGITDDRSEVGAAVAKWKAFLTEMVNNGTPLTLSLALYEPQTYQLTPQQIQLLKGSNTLWSDGDSLTLTYLGTTPANLLGGMLGGGLGGGYNPPAEQDPEELTEPEATETDEPAEETPAEEGENNGE